MFTSEDGAIEKTMDMRSKKADMKQLKLSITLPAMTSITEAELKMILASRLYENGQLSLGQAADMAGISKRAFAELLGQYGVSLFSQTSEELRRDILNA